MCMCLGLGYFSWSGLIWVVTPMTTISQILKFPHQYSQLSLEDYDYKILVWSWVNKSISKSCKLLKHYPLWLCSTAVNIVGTQVGGYNKVPSITSPHSSLKVKPLTVYDVDKPTSECRGPWDFLPKFVPGQSKRWRKGQVIASVVRQLLRRWLTEVCSLCLSQSSGQCSQWVDSLEVLHWKELQKMLVLGAR